MQLPALTKTLASFGHAAIWVGLISVLSPTIGVANSTTVHQSFSIEDYFRIKDITELAISTDGEMIAFVARSASLIEDNITSTVYVSETALGSKPRIHDAIGNASSIAWIPNTHALAFLSPDENGVSQVFSIHALGNTTRQHTYSDKIVTQYQFSPDGQFFAWLSIDPDDEAVFVDFDYKRSNLYKRLFEGIDGIVIDTETTSVYNFLDPEAPDLESRPLTTLHITSRDRDTQKIDVPGQVKRFYWSPDGLKLSITYVAYDIPRAPLSDRRTSLGVLDIASRTFHPLFNANAGRSFTGGEWAPDAGKLFVRRTMTDANKPAWAVVDLELNDKAGNAELDWHTIEIYPWDPEPLFMPVTDDLVFSNKTIHAQRSLYAINPLGAKRAKIVRNINGSTSLVQFSQDFETAAFAIESLMEPPEIYIWRKGRGTLQLTQLNALVGNKQLPNAREVSWRSKDNTIVYGWLLEPVGEKSVARPWPLVTFVHGGPSLAFLNEFAYYFKEFDGLWPYPFEVYALHGVAVFIPNYRGTSSFGGEYGKPASQSDEPVVDILSGIEHLIDNGIADRDLLAIAGQSHGAWLAAYTMSQSRQLKFKVGSFSEGTLNKIVQYSVMPGFLNRVTHDVVIGDGVSLYEDPQPYVMRSPDFHFNGLCTSVLFEAGAKSLALNMMGSVKSAQRAGMPAEFVVYPRTGHNIRIPHLQKESAERNLDWFRFWLQNYEDPVPDKAEQYARWRKMQDEQCAQLKDQDNARLGTAVIE